MKDPNTDTNTIDVLAPSLDDAPPLMARLQQLPEVARVTSLESFIPQDQDEKLAIIAPVASSQSWASFTTTAAAKSTVHC